MAVKTKEELITSITTIFGEEPDDERLGFLDDLADSIDDFASKSNTDEIERLKKENAELDASWRKRYIERFKDTSSTKEEPTKNEVMTEEMSYDDLFN